MGMGKSLTVLALVLHTQTDALNFLSDTRDDVVSNPRQRLRATLVIAPKSSTHEHALTKCHLEKRKLTALKQSRIGFAKLTGRVTRMMLLLFLLTKLRHLLPRSLIVAIYHGSQRWERSTIEGSDIVITTYETIAVESGSDSGLLKQYAWFRVVLDEGMVPTQPG